jgi:antitoxin FitA
MIMAQMVVRNLDDDVKLKLQQRARQHRRSTEEEVREILREAVRSEPQKSKPLGKRPAQSARVSVIRGGGKFDSAISQHDEELYVAGVRPARVSTDNTNTPACRSPLLGMFHPQRPIVVAHI